MKFPDIRKPGWRNLDLMIVGLTEIIDGFCLFISLGTWTPSVTVRYTMWRSLKMIHTYVK